MDRLRSYCVIASLVFWRELLVLAHAWKSVVSSVFIYGTLLSLSAGYFMPAMGMPAALSAQLYLGAFIVNSYSIGYTCAIEIAFDLRSPKLGAYYYSLPVPFGMVMVARVLGVLARMLLVGVPVLLLGFAIIGRWECFSVSWAAAALMFLLTVQYLALLFSLLAHTTPLPSLLGNIWPRFLSPMAAFGCVMYPLKVVTAKAWWLSRIMLLNPMVYCCEGMRGALFGGHDHLNLLLCIMVLLCVNGTLWALLRRGIIRAVNPVLMRKA